MIVFKYKSNPFSAGLRLHPLTPNGAYRLGKGGGSGRGKEGRGRGRGSGGKDWEERDGPTAYSPILKTFRRPQ